MAGFSVPLFGAVVAFALGWTLLVALAVYPALLATLSPDTAGVTSAILWIAAPLAGFIAAVEAR